MTLNQTGICVGTTSSLLLRGHASPTTGDVPVSNYRSRRHVGFTLIELLVVIEIRTWRGLAQTRRQWY